MINKLTLDEIKKQTLEEKIGKTLKIEIITNLGNSSLCGGEACDCGDGCDE